MAGLDDVGRDEEAGPLVPLYALTGGRAHPTYSQLGVASLVIASGTVDLDAADVEPELAEILRLCRAWSSVAEVSSHLKVPLAVAKVQISDLIDAGAMRVSASTVTSAAGRPTYQQLERVLDGLRAI